MMPKPHELEDKVFSACFPYEEMIASTNAEKENIEKAVSMG